MSETAEPARPLPRGRHKLSREEVAASQRERILRALAEAMAEKGYVATSVADVLRRAGVSRETFYQQFASKEDAFTAAYETAVGMVISGASANLATANADDPPLVRLDRALSAYLEALASEPAFARVFLIEVYAAGPIVLQRRAELQQGFAALIVGAVGAGDDDDRFAAEAIVAAISALVTARAAAGDADGMRALREPLIRLAERLFGDR